MKVYDKFVRALRVYRSGECFDLSDIFDMRFSPSRNHKRAIEKGKEPDHSELYKSMTPRQLQAFILHYQRGLTVQNIADITAVKTEIALEALGEAESKVDAHLERIKQRKQRKRGMRNVLKRVFGKSSKV